MGEETLLKTLEAHNQQHIIDHYEKLTSEKQRQFLDNLHRTNLDIVFKIFK